MTVKKKIPYPKSVFFIVSNEFCERFSYYGMRTILILYLRNVLLFTETDSKIIYHAFTMFVYFFPVFGAIISDSWLGKFNTIFYVSIIYAVGSILLALSSAPLGIPQVAFTMLGLSLIAVGTGGIKPCVSAFGGDQFVLPQQELQLATFFSLFYFSINAGSLISTFLTPILREKVHCFDNDTCYPLAFAVPGVLMIVSIVIFGLGKPLYKIKKPQGNVVVQVSKCIGHGFSKYIKRDKSQETKAHWLDYAEDKYSNELISNVKATLKVLVLYIPLPIFWALYDQQGSGWTFQATRMDGNIGFYTILPDQMQVVNPLLILAFIPLFTYVVYPSLAKINLLKTPLQRMVCGGFLAAAAFAVSACVSLALEGTYPVLPEAGNVHLRIYNPTSCDITLKSDILNADVNKFNSSVYTNISYEGHRNVNFDGEITCDRVTSKHPFSHEIKDGFAYGIYATETGFFSYLDNIEKSDDGNPVVRTLTNKANTTIKYSNEDSSLTVSDSEQHSIDIGSYKIDGYTMSFKFDLGGKYVVMLDSQGGGTNIVVTEPNSVNMLWLLPQYFIITAAEIMFSITGLELSYSQAPVSMKSVLQACFLLTTAFGNLIIVIIESGEIFEKQSYDFFLYTGLMVVDMLLFAYLAVKYKYVNLDTSDSGDETQIEDVKKEGLENPAFKE